MINPSDYKRTGIFIEERYTGQNNIVAPSAPNVHFVPGFSKKSTVFNKPVLLTSSNDRKTYFGDIDRGAEKKGSFFHRTIDVALQTAPVYALNLLKTDVNDTLDYASLSLSAQYTNLDVDNQQYDDFFNKTGFWQRDTESFLFFTKNKPGFDGTQKMHMANVGNKNITFFTFKVSDAQFDITAEQFYANKEEEIPTWINPKSLMNDYMIRTVVVAGDFTNYAQLSVDTTFFKYFASSGLRKAQVNNFLRDRSVTVLGDYSGSVIPYFTDMTGRNLFIESLINNETDKTGLFMAMDIDSIETDYPTGVIDLIGETLVGLDHSEINFLSYKDTIKEVDVFTKFIGDDNFVKPIIDDINGVLSATTNTTTPTVTVNLTGKFINVGGVDIAIKALAGSKFIESTITPGTYTYNAETTFTPTPSTRHDLVYITKNGDIDVCFVEGSASNPTNYPNDAYPLFVIENIFTTSTDATSTFKDVNGASITALTYNGYSVVMSSTSTDPISFVVTGNSMDITFKCSTIKGNYGEYLVNNIYNEFSINSNPANNPNAYIYNGTTKLPIDTVSEDISVASVKKITLYTSSSIGTPTNIFYTDKNIDSINGNPTSLYGYSTTGGVGYALMGKESRLYTYFINGMINTGDYFLTSFGDISYDVVNHLGDTFIVMTITEANTLGLNLGTNNKNITIPQLTENSIKIETGYDNSSYTFIPVTTHLGFKVVSDVALPDTTTTTTHEFLDSDNVMYLKMYTENGDDVKIDFYRENTLTTRVASPYIHLSDSINIYSGESNYTQTLEIESHTAYTDTDTKFLISMDRYSEVKINDYVEAFYDIAELELGEQPKKFARIIKKTAWSGNVSNGTQFAEITVDVKYNSRTITGGKSQTTRYTTIENYIDTYKGIKLNGFKIQEHSMPNGTETRQNEILSILDKDTSLYNAIVNKQKFNFRYLIDSFGLGLTEFSKQNLMNLVGKRKNSIALLNAPSAKQFKNSTSPYFINDDGTLNMEFVKKGGDEERNPAFLYSFGQGSGKDDGRDCSAYFFPYVTVNDNGRPLSFPPAAYVANAYMRKNSSTISGKYNFTVAAGVNDGLILGIANTEMDFVETDYEFADAMGLNLLSYNSNYGFYIETEYTASVTPKTALSNLHTRELLIDMENEMYAMLFKYQYQFNLPAIRAKIKREADDICQKYYERGGITYYLNVIDETNNTAELIDNQFGLLETTIVPVSAMAKIVNIFNITNNGALGGSSGFSA